MNNLEIREFSQAIINFIKKSPLPIEVKRLCINDIAAQLQQAADAQIETEILQRDQRPAEKNNTEQEETNELIKDSPEDSVEEQDRTGA